jgi:hypothetical protein
MSRVVRSDPKQRLQFEPLYDIDPRTGATIEVFYADRALAKSFGMRGPGWCWWSCQQGLMPGAPTGPFGTSYLAYGDAQKASDEARVACSGPPNQGITGEQTTNRHRVVPRLLLSLFWASQPRRLSKIMIQIKHLLVQLGGVEPPTS